MMIDHQTYFSQLLMPVFSHWDSEPRSQFFLAYMARSSNTVPFGPGGFFPLPMGISMDFSMDLHRWTWDFSIGHPPSSLMVYPLDVHWMVYHPLEDGLPSLGGWFTKNWMVYRYHWWSTQLDGLLNFFIPGSTIRLEALWSFPRIEAPIWTEPGSWEQQKH